MSSVRRVSALLTLAALVSPFAGGAALTAHAGALLPSHHAHDDQRVDVDDDHDVDLNLHDDDVYDHHRDSHDHAYDFQQVWHGHRHDRTTPEHSHPSVFAGAPLMLGPAAPRMIPSHGSHTIERAGHECGSPNGSHAITCVLADVGPSPPYDPPVVLRV
jgi:hypothetical protein